MVQCYISFKIAMRFTYVRVFEFVANSINKKTTNFLKIQKSQRYGGGVMWWYIGLDAFGECPRKLNSLLWKER